MKVEDPSSIYVAVYIYNRKSIFVYLYHWALQAYTNCAFWIRNMVIQPVWLFVSNNHDNLSSINALKILRGFLWRCEIKTPKWLHKICFFGRNLFCCFETIVILLRGTSLVMRILNTLKFAEPNKLHGSENRSGVSFEGKLFFPPYIFPFTLLPYIVR